MKPVYNFRAFDGIWHLDPSHSWVGLSVKYAGITNIQAYFSNVEAQLDCDQHDEIATVSATVYTDSIHSNNVSRDKVLRSEDFLWCEQYPVMQFDGVTDTERLCGALQIRGVSNNLSFHIDSFGHTIDETGQERIGAAAFAEISRTDFGMTWNTTLRDGSMLVSDTVQIQLHVNFVKANEPNHDINTVPVLKEQQFMVFD